ncbi:uncharacterized protein K452DRAFT_356317 [Aplosporella prunicola CBS 121167]|uniref:RRM domain-containing protein n=1 Tax=Aplosporella prunicola CBS 121167 TaxID=1176127 RepID=A0A6A6BNH8_9PEZI|nr:uncharacterized protein K452DRAFT_356317 [Aplosporella prunicola CBS 121167]KAF2144973.1 hypothetical protein K452DRAFT_356317 [Aplosporella prunicola CBS 121167]
MTTVHVENISQQTSEKEIRDFFSFCGKIQNLSVTPTNENSQSATVTFEKETAAKTALLLDNTQLGPAQVHVTSAKSIEEIAGDKATDEAKVEKENIDQEDKPRGRIIAEYLAHGYVISDKAITQALALDQQHGVSSRFTSTLKSFDQKYKATEKAQAVDSKYAVTEKAMQGWRGLNSYFEKALGTPTGQKLRQFYEQGNKQVVDVHNEARYLADLKKQQQQEKAGVHQEPGSDRTTCNCGSSTEKCPCPPGKCGCTSCAKNPGEQQQASTGAPIDASSAAHSSSTTQPSAAS